MKLSGLQKQHPQRWRVIMHYSLLPREGASSEHIQLFNGTISQTQTESFCFYLS